MTSKPRPRPTGWSSTSSLLIHLGSHGSLLVQEIFANASSFIKKPATLSTLVTRSTSSTGTARRRKGLGDLYEGLLEKNANEKKSGAGQYFTPRPLIDSMVAVMKPTLGDIIQDPAAGTGGFLIAANRYIREHTTRSLDRSPAAQIPPRHLLRHGARAGHPPPGADEPDAARHRFGPEGGRHPLRRHALAEGQALPKATLILTNPPFGTKKGGGCPRATTSPTPPATSSSAFLQHIYRGLKPGGRAAVVLPDNVLFESNVGQATSAAT
jgi:type I restriction enzyme M protein